MVPNALAAAAVGLFLGVPPDGVAAGLAEAELSPWRMELATSPSGVLVLNDSYNANPASMSAALQALASLPGNGRRLAVLGLMAELGDRTSDEHTRIAADAEARSVEVIPVGTDLYGSAAVDGIDGALMAIAEAGLVAGDALLIKGSRVVGLEAVASHLLER
jgi:UDP-N-acetylmuramoyl-tripeptide--D-alanyl-D-alanine ligase